MEACGLVTTYVVSGRSYGFFVTWGKHQRVRAKESKHPAPTSADICGHLPSNAPVVIGYGVKGKGYREEGKELPPLPPKGDDGFERFYRTYPKKKGKAAALKAWKKLNPSPELQITILTAIEHAKQTPSWQKDNGQFIPYPATWLNGQRWEDEEKVTLPTAPEPPGEFDHLPRVSGNFAICGCDRDNPAEVCRAAYHGMTVDQHSAWADEQRKAK